MKGRSIFFVIIVMMSAIISYPGLSFSQEDKSPRIKYLEFREVDIKDVLRQLAKQYNLNIVFSESVKGAITVQLSDVTLEEALDAIITINGFVYTKKGGVIKVTTSEEAEKETKRTRVFRLNNADAVALKETIKKVLSSDGTIEADSRSNSLIVTDIPTVLNKVEEMIPSLDEDTPQVLIEAKFIETVLGTTEKLGIKWTVHAEATGSSRPTTVPFNKWGSDKDMYPVPEHTTKVNQSTGQITVTSDFPIKNDSYLNPNGGMPGFGAFPTVGASYFTFGTLDFTELQSILEFIMTNTNSKLISAPRVVTLDNKEAVMHVGKARPIPKFEFNSDTGEYQITDFEEKIEGVTLTVTPQVSRGRDNKYKIKLKLVPKVTTFSENVPFSAPSFNYPVMSERFADTEVMIENSQTIVIGGLIQKQKTESTRKVPLLGDLPLFGSLFRHKEIDPNTRTELLIFVTARVLDSNEEALPGFKSGIVTSPPRPLKLDIREVSLNER